MPTTKEVLIAARKLIEAGWAHDPYKKGWNGCHCISTAITKAAGDAGVSDMYAHTAFAHAIGMQSVYSGVIEWNDAPDRTHAEVLAAFDKAIAAS